MKIRTIAIALSALVSACAATVQSTVTVFHSLPPSGNGDTVAILAADQAQNGTLEFRAFAAQLAAYLEADGYRIVPLSPSDKPKFLAFFGYGIDNGTLLSSSYSIPQYGMTGYSSSTTTGTIDTFGNFGTVEATTTYTPTYGITGYQTGTTVDRVYRRVVSLDILDTARIRPNDANSFREAQVYSGRLSSDGSCGAIAAVIEPLLATLTKDFPGENGKTRRGKQTWDPTKC
jgi:hypothetical protein